MILLCVLSEALKQKKKKLFPLRSACYYSSASFYINNHIHKSLTEIIIDPNNICYKSQRYFFKVEWRQDVVSLKPKSKNKMNTEFNKLI